MILMKTSLPHPRLAHPITHNPRLRGMRPFAKPAAPVRGLNHVIQQTKPFSSLTFTLVGTSFLMYTTAYGTILAYYLLRICRGPMPNAGVYRCSA